MPFASTPIPFYKRRLHHISEVHDYTETSSTRASMTGAYRRSIRAFTKITGSQTLPWRKLGRLITSGHSVHSLVAMSFL